MAARSLQSDTVNFGHERWWHSKPAAPGRLTLFPHSGDEGGGGEFGVFRLPGQLNLSSLINTERTC